MAYKCRVMILCLQDCIESSDGKMSGNSCGSPTLPPSPPLSVSLPTPSRPAALVASPSFPLPTLRPSKRKSKVTSLADWASESDGRGGGRGGCLPTAPVKVEVVPEGGGDAAGTIKGEPTAAVATAAGVASGVAAHGAGASGAAGAGAGAGDAAGGAAGVVSAGAAAEGVAGGTAAGSTAVPARQRVCIPPLQVREELRSEEGGR